jgi:hypothetical protein
MPVASSRLDASSSGSGWICGIGPWTRKAQWRGGVARLAHGAPSTALMTAYRGPGEEPHLLWALWREDSHVYVQVQGLV